VVVVDAGTVVVVDVGDVVVVVAGTVVVVTTVVVVVLVVVVVVGGVTVAHALGTGVDASAELPWAAVEVAVAKRTVALSASESRVPRRSRWCLRRVTQRIYNAPRHSKFRRPEFSAAREEHCAMSPTIETFNRLSARKP
jgi:hypothetical protein